MFPITQQSIGDITLPLPFGPTIAVTPGKKVKFVQVGKVKNEFPTCFRRKQALLQFINTILFYHTFPKKHPSFS